MGGNDVPEQHVLFELEVREHTLYDGRGRLGRARASELPLGGERNARHASAAVAWRLPHEQSWRSTAASQVCG